MNIRIAIAVIVSFFLFQSSQAQDTVKPVYVKDTIKANKKHFITEPKYPRDGYVAITAGVGIPVGAYAINGCAAAGGTGSVSIAFPGLISHCGIAFKFDYGINEVNKNQLLDTLKKESPLSNINYYLLDVGQFYYKTFLAGLYLTYPGKHLTIDGRILMGVMVATLPSASIKLYDELTENSGIENLYAVSGTAFAIDFGIEARYHITQKTSLLLGIDYLHSSPTFTEAGSAAVVTPTGMIQVISQVLPTSQAFSVFNFSMGVGYTISAKKPVITEMN